MKQITIRSSFAGETYLTGEADVCWANRPIEERAFCAGCHRHKGKDRTNCGALMLIDRLAAIEDILGDEYDLDRLRELVEADREGRCVVLPCKRYDILWTLFDPPSKTTYSFYVTDLSTLNGQTVLNTDIAGVIDARDIGKTVFRTRAEAEAALKARED